MKRSHLSALTFALATVVAGHAFAADASAPKTRAEVKAELAQALRNGDFYVGGESNVKANELYPQLYPAKSAVQGKTRAEVKAELAEAIRNGEMPVQVGETVLTAREAYPHLYPTQTEVSGKTRAQVQAELKEAVRSGSLPVYGEGA